MADKKEKGKKGSDAFDWMRVHMMQFVVLINGLILTGATFFVLEILIDNMIEKKVDGLLNDNRQEVVEGFSNYERSFESISSLFHQAVSLSDDELIKMFRYAGEIQARKFDQVYWIRTSGERIRAIPLLKKDEESQRKKGYGFAFNSPTREIFDELISKAENEKEIKLITNFPGTEYVQMNTSPRTMFSPVALVYPVYKSGQSAAYVIAFISISEEPKIIKYSAKGAISRFSIIDPEQNTQIYHMDWLDNVQSQSAYEDAHYKTFEFLVAGTPLNVRVGFKKSDEERFIELVPWLLLGFGSILTLTGWLYVRNNQKQSIRLRSMNKTLAEKNMELNLQISESERLNQTIVETESENKAILDSVKDIIFDVGNDGKILFLNEAWNRVTGFKTADSIGQNIFDMLHPDDKEEQKRNFQLFAQGQKEPYRIFTRLSTENGSFRAVELAISMIRHDEDGKLRIVGTFTDVEARRRAERALTEAEKKYRTIWENAAGGIFQLTMEGRYLTANPAMARILGYDNPQSLVEKIENAHKEVYVDSNERRRFLKDVERSRDAKSIEAEVLKKDGTRIWIYENARAVRDEEGNLLYFEGSFEDITERKSADINLRQAKMESDLANRAKSEFLANMSHELRTPLNAIIGFAEIIKNEVFGPIEKKAYWEYACDIFDSGKHLLHVINEILDVSRIEAGERQLNETAVDLKKLVTSSISLMNSKADTAELTIIDLVPETLPNIVGEELAIKQIVINILSNAIKFTQSGGRITINGEHHVQAGELHLSITDTGVGLDEEEISKALSPFGQLNSSLSRSGSGTGLGLTLVDALMKLHNGRVDLVSQKGVGTTVILVFPESRISARKNNNSDSFASQPAQPQLAQPQPAQPQPAQPQPAQPQPAQPQPAQSQPAQPQPAQLQPAQPQPAQSQPAQSQPEPMATLKTPEDAPTAVLAEQVQQSAATPVSASASTDAQQNSSSVKTQMTISKQDIEEEEEEEEVEKFPFEDLIPLSVRSPSSVKKKEKLVVKPVPQDLSDSHDDHEKEENKETPTT